MALLTWEYGITTVPSRRKDLLPRTISSLNRAGFTEPHVFVDGCGDPSEYDSLGLDCTVRSQRIRTSGHWVTSLWELWTKNSNADRYAIFQDDFVIAKNAKHYLDSCKWPRPGYLNLLTFRENYELIGRKSIGWHKSDQLGKGAVALVFDNESVASLLSNPHLVQWLKNQSKGHRLIDRAISQSMKKKGLTEHIHNPSLIQHTGLKSSMGSDKHPLSTCFRGEEYDAMRFLGSPAQDQSLIDADYGKPVIRVALPAVDSEDLTIECLRSLFRSNWPVVVDYVDNGSKDGVSDRIVEFANSIGLQIECTRFKKNRGFTEAVNVSISKAIHNKQHCLILNNDCFVASTTVERLYRAMISEDSIAAVGPLSMDKGNQSLKRRKRLWQSGLKHLPRDASDTEGISRSLKYSGSTQVKRLAFFCSLLKYEAMAKVGLLSSDLKDGLGADDLWCHFARKHGMTCNIALNAYANHMHSETFKRLGLNRRKMAKVATRKLRKYN